MSDFLESLANIGRAVVGAPSVVSGGSTEDSQKTVSNLQAYRESVAQESALKGEQNSKLAEYMQIDANTQPEMISQRSTPAAIKDSLLGIGTGIAQPIVGSLKGVVSPEAVLAIDGFFEGARDWQSPQAKAQTDDWRQKQNVFTEALEQAVAEGKIDSLDAQIAIAKNSFKDLSGTMIQHIASEGAGNVLLLAGATAVGAGPAAWTAMGVSSASEPASAIAESLYGRDAKGEFKLTHEDLMESPKYREYMEKYNDPARARRLLYGDSKNMAILSLENLSATAVGMFGERLLFKSAGLLGNARITKSLSGFIGSGVIEVGTENIENIGHTVATNKAAQKYYDQDRDTLAGTGADVSQSTIGALGGVSSAYPIGVTKAVGSALLGRGRGSSSDADEGEQSTPRQDFQNLVTPKTTPPDKPDDEGGAPTQPSPEIKPDSPLKPAIDSLKWEDLTEEQEPNEAIRGILNGSTDQVDAAYRVGEAIKSGNLSPEDSLSLFNDFVRPVFGTLHQITQASQEAMSKLEDGDESLATLQQWGEVSKAVGSDVELQAAVTAAMEATTKVNLDLDTSKRGSEQLDTVRNIENVVDVNADTLTEQQIDDALALKEFDPNSVPEPESSPFKPATIKKLQTLKSIFEAQKVAQSKSGNTAIGNEITLGEGSGAKGLSTKGHAVAILDMLESGDKEGAKEQLAVLGRFLQSQKNKAAALIAGRDSGESEQTYQTTGANYVSPAEATITYMPEGAGAKLLRTVQAEVEFIQSVVDDLTATVEGKKQTKSTPAETIVEATANPNKQSRGDIKSWSDDELDYQRDRLRSYKTPTPTQVDNLAKVEAEVLRRDKEEAATEDMNEALSRADKDREQVATEEWNTARSRAQEDARVSQEIEGDNRLPEPDKSDSTLSQDFKNKVNARVDKLSPSELDNLLSKLEGNKNPDNREMYLLDSLRGRKEELSNEEAQTDAWINSMFGVEDSTPTVEPVVAPTQQQEVKTTPVEQNEEDVIPPWIDTTDTNDSQVETPSSVDTNDDVIPPWVDTSEAQVTDPAPVAETDTTTAPKNSSPSFLAPIEAAVESVKKVATLVKELDSVEQSIKKTTNEDTLTDLEEKMENLYETISENIDGIIDQLIDQLDDMPSLVAEGIRDELHDLKDSEEESNIRIRDLSTVLRTARNISNSTEDMFGNDTPSVTTTDMTSQDKAKESLGNTVWFKSFKIAAKATEFWNKTKAVTAVIKALGEKAGESGKGHRALAKRLRAKSKAVVEALGSSRNESSVLGQLSKAINATNINVTGPIGQEIVSAFAKKHGIDQADVDKAFDVKSHPSLPKGQNRVPSATATEAMLKLLTDKEVPNPEAKVNGLKRDLAALRPQYRMIDLMEYDPSTNTLTAPASIVAAVVLGMQEYINDFSNNAHSHPPDVDDLKQFHMAFGYDPDTVPNLEYIEVTWENGATTMEHIPTLMSTGFVTQSTARGDITESVLRLMGVRQSGKAREGEFYHPMDNLIGTLMDRTTESNADMDVAYVHTASKDNKGVAVKSAAWVYPIFSEKGSDADVARSAQSAISEELKTDKVQVKYFGTPPPQKTTNKAGQTISESQQKAKDYQESIPFVSNRGFVNTVLNVLGEFGIIEAFGFPEANDPDSLLNRYDRTSKNGKNLSLLNSLKELENLETVLADNPETEVFYSADNSSVSRLMMNGGNNPQANKVIRGAMSPNRTTIDASSFTRDVLFGSTSYDDLSKTDKFLVLAYAQALGVSIHNNTHQQNLEKLKEIVNSEGFYENASDWFNLSTGDKSTNASDVIADSKRLLKNDWSELGLQTLIEIGGLLNSTEEGTSDKFTTHAYIEADGITNGPFMAAMMLGVAPTDPSWITFVQNAGLIFGKDGNSNEYRSSQLSTPDNYGDVASDSKGFLRESLDKSLEFAKVIGTSMMNQFKQHDAIATSFMSNVFNHVSIDESGNVSYTRNTAKNPVTVTFYGSGTKGIAAKFTKEAVDVINEIQSAILKTARMSDNGKQAVIDWSAAATMFYEGTPDASLLIQAKVDKLDATLKAISRMTSSKKVAFKNSKTGKVYAFISNNAKADGPKVPPFTMVQPNDVINLERLTNNTLSRDQLAILTENLTEYMAEPLTKSLESKATSTLDATKIIKDATNSYSHMVKKILDSFLLEAKENIYSASNPDGYHPVYGYSNKTLKDLKDRMIRMGLTAEIAGKLFSLMVTERSGATSFTGNHGVASLSTTGNPSGLSTDSRQVGFGTLGVAGIPRFVQASGDAATITNFLNEALLAGMGKFMQIYDGINLSADNWEQGSKMANNAVMQAIKDRPLNGLIKQMKKIDRFGNLWDHVDFHDIKRLQKQVNAGLDLLEKHAFSIDHLAAAGNNAYHEGKTFDTSDPAEIARIMSGKETAPTVAQGVQEVTTAYPESEHGKEFSDDERQNLLVNAALAFKGDDLSYSMFKAVVKAAKDKGVTFMKGATSSYLRRFNTLSLRNDKPETLAHELSHAVITSTIDIIGGSKKGRVTTGSRNAYKNLVTLFDEVMNSGEYKAYPVIQKAMEHAIEAEQNALKYGSTAKQAEADKINEFVVTFINSPDVMAVTKTMKPQSTLIKLTKAVWKFISEALGMDNVSDDNLHNVLVQQWAALSEGTIEDLKYIPLKQAPELNNFEFSKSDSDTAAKIKIKEVYEKALGLSDIQDTVSRGKNIAAAIESSDALANTGLLANQQEEDAFYNANLMFRISQDVDPSGQTGLRKIANHVIKNLKPEHFGNTDIQDSPAYYTAHNKYNDVLGTLNSDRGSLVPNLIALSYASAEMRSVLNTLGMPKATEGYDRNSTFEQYLGQLGYTAIAKVSDLLDKTKGVPSEAVKELVEGLGKKPQGRAVSELLTLPGIAMDKANAFVSDGLSALAQQASKVGENVGKSNSKSGKALGAVIQTIAGVVDKETSTQAAETVTKMLNSTDGTNVFKDVFRDIIGRIPSNAKIYDLTKLVRSAVQRMRTMYVEGTPANIQKRFKTLPTPEQWKALTKSLADTDIAAVSLIHGVSRTIELLSDKNKLSSRISELESKLSAGHIRKSKQLAKFLTTRQTGGNLLKNATDIARMFGEAEEQKEASKDLVRTIDEYVSLLAYSSMDNSVVEGMFKSEPDALDFMMSIQVGIAREEQRKGVNAATQGWKGYIPKPLSGSIKIFSDAEGKRMESRGYVRVGDYVGSKLDLDRTKRGYYVSTVNQNRPFAQGIIQNAIRSNNGIDSATGRSSVNFTDKHMNLDPSEALLLKARIRNDNAKYGIVPLYSNEGVIYGYERMIDPSMMEDISKNENLSEMLGVQRGRQMEEAIASTVNRSVVDELEANYVEVKDSSQFIDILDSSSYENDKVLKDAVGILSQEAKDYAKSTYGRMMVKKDMLTNVVGYRQLGFASFFDGTTNLDKKTNKAIVTALEATIGKNAYKHLVRGEDAWRGFVADAKQLIVVKSVVVPAINALSNIVHLIARGVPLASLAKIPAKIIEIEQYVSNTKRMIEIESELLAASNSPYKIVKLKAERDSLQESNSRMTIAPLIQAGEFTSIVSASVDQESSELHSGKVAEYIEGGLNRLSGPAQTVARNVIISRDTAVYQFLQKSVDYGDFVAKAILYDDIVTRQGKSKESALGAIKEEFINYDYLPGRVRGSLEGLGILWFFNFKVRSLKIALSMIRENPLHAIAAMHGVPTQTPMGELEIALDSNVVYKLLDGSIPYSVGPSMGMESYRLHPLYNLMH